MKILCVLAALVFTGTICGQTTWKGKTYNDARLIGFEHVEGTGEGKSSPVKRYEVASNDKSYYLESAGFTNNLAKAQAGDKLLILVDGKKLHVLLNKKDSTYKIVGIKNKQ